jgi:starvation-inducible DNA-binding protein
MMNFETPAEEARESTVDELTEVFNNNFVAYFRSHVAHVNIMGRNFASDHALLGGIYEELQDQIDTIAELLRSLGAFMPDNLMDVLEDAEINTYSMVGSAEDMLAEVRNDLDQLKDSYEELMEKAEMEGLDEIANYAQDRLLALAKHIWMLDSTLS